MHDRPARFVDNHDGDTATMMLDQDFFATQTINVRLANVWAPEPKDKGYVQAKAYLRFLMVGQNAVEKWPFIVITHETATGNQVKSFDRFVADIIRAIDGVSINSEMMKYLTQNGFTGGTGFPEPQGKKV